MTDGFKIGDGYIEIKHKLDAAAIRRDVRTALSSAEGSSGGILIDTRFSRAQVNRALRATLAEGAGSRPTVLVNADFSSVQIERSLQRATRMIRNHLEIEVDVDVDRDNSAPRKIKKIAEEGERLFGVLGGQLAHSIVKFSEDIPELRTIGMGVGAIIAQGAVPLLAAGVSGAITAGAAAGVLGLGITLLKDNEQVAAAGKATGAAWASHLQGAAAPLIAPVLDSLHQLDGLASRVAPELQRSFAIVAGLIKPIVDGVDKSVMTFLPLLNQGLPKAKPVIDAFANELPRVSDAVGRAFVMLSEHAGQGAVAIKLLLRLTEGTLLLIAGGVSALADGFEYLVRQYAITVDTLASLPVVGKTFEDEAQRAKRALASMHADPGPILETGDAIKHLGKNADMAAKDVKTLSQAFDELFGKTLDVDQATLAYNEAIASLRESLNEGKRGFDQTTESGREHTRALLDAVDAARQSYDANVANGMAIGDATAQYNAQIASIEAVLRSMGYTQAQIDALIGKYRQIPARAETQVNAVGALSAAQAVERMGRAIDSLHDKTVYVTQVEAPVGQAPRRKAMGGFERAAAGRYAATVGGALTLLGESGTGGEYAIPLRGISPVRARAMADDIGAHYGFSTTDGQAGAGGPVTVSATIVLGSEVITRTVRAEIKRATTPVADSTAAGNQQRRYLSTARR